MSKCEADRLGNKRWYNSDGEYHREDGPAIEFANGGKSWWINGELHREDGPAVEYADGSKQWWINNKKHRKYGPAIEYADGDKSWYYHGERIDVKTQEEFSMEIALR